MGKRMAVRWMNILLMAVATHAATAQDRSPLREARSASGRFVLRVQAGRSNAGGRQACRAALYEDAKGQLREGKRWEGNLVNDIAPAQACVRDDGKFLVTLDEFRRGGARNALVIYGEKGQLLRHFLLPDLLTRDDWKHIRSNKKTIEWLTGAQAGFADPNQFAVRLKWGRQIRIDLKTLTLLRKEGEETPGGAPPEALAQLFDDQEGPAGPLEEMAKRTGMSREQLEKLQQLGYLKAPASQPADGAADQQVAELAHLMAAGDMAASQPAEPPVPQPDAQVPEVPPAAPAAIPAAEQPPNADTTPPMSPEPPAANAGMMAGAVIPPPNPANPTDYLGWVNQLTVTAGPSAVPELQAAIDALVELPKETEDLFSRALQGDADALESPELAEWLAQNRPALERYRSATKYEFNGFPLRSEDGTVIGALLPNLSKMRRLGRIAILEGKRLEQRAQPQQALGYYLDALAGGAQAGHGYTAIENLVGQAVQNQAANAVMDLAAGPHADQIDFSVAAQQLAEAYQPVRPLQDSMLFERVGLLDELQHIYKIDTQTGAQSVDPQQTKRLVEIIGLNPKDVETWMANAGQTRFEDTVAEANVYYDTLADAMTLPYQDSMATFAQLHETVDSASANPLLKTFLPDFRNLRENVARSEARRQAALTVAQIVAYRQQNGQYPSSLAELGPSAGIDPYTDQPLTYRPQGGGFTLYSVGRNGVDDGGVDDAKAQTNDIVYWPRPQPEPAKPK
jgi:hypothetical protein